MSTGKVFRGCGDPLNKAVKSNAIIDSGNSGNQTGFRDLYGMAAADTIFQNIDILGREERLKHFTVRSCYRNIRRRYSADFKRGSGRFSFKTAFYDTQTERQMPGKFHPAENQTVSGLIKIPPDFRVKISNFSGHRRENALFIGRVQFQIQIMSRLPPHSLICPVLSFSALLFCILINKESNDCNNDQQVHL